mmetsp:Transcript_42572/g.76454  ORF Transcript_42572/g.76454 Transcript_42572/m.76454 type:complete len:318 (-) Transcript_42572:109-1062(-)
MVVTRRSEAPATTWWLVTMCPASSQMKPEPLPRGIWVMSREKSDFWIPTRCRFVMYTTLGAAWRNRSTVDRSSGVRRIGGAGAALSAGTASTAGGAASPLTAISEERQMVAVRCPSFCHRGRSGAAGGGLVRGSRGPASPPKLGSGTPSLRTSSSHSDCIGPEGFRFQAMASPPTRPNAPTKPHTVRHVRLGSGPAGRPGFLRGREAGGRDPSHSAAKGTSAADTSACEAARGARPPRGARPTDAGGCGATRLTGVRRAAEDSGSTARSSPAAPGRALSATSPTVARAPTPAQTASQPRGCRGEAKGSLAASAGRES